MALERETHLRSCFVLRSPEIKTKQCYPCWLARLVRRVGDEGIVFGIPDAQLAHLSLAALADEVGDEGLGVVVRSWRNRLPEMICCPLTRLTLTIMQYSWKCAIMFAKRSESEVISKQRAKKITPYI